MSLTFAVTYDYRCPFGRIAHDHVVTGLEAGADWDVTFLPFSLQQNHVEPGEPDVWDAPHTDSGLLALEVSVAVREADPDGFLRLHRALFDHRHVDGGRLDSLDVLGPVLESVGISAQDVFDEVATGRPRKIVQTEHERGVADLDVWGVPIFIVGERAAFARLMELPADADDAVSTVERLVDLFTWTELNEFKHTSLDR